MCTSSFIGWLLLSIILVNFRCMLTCFNYVEPYLKYSSFVYYQILFILACSLITKYMYQWIDNAQRDHHAWTIAYSVTRELNIIWRSKLHPWTPLSKSHKGLEAHGCKSWVANLSIIPNIPRFSFGGGGAGRGREGEGNGRAIISYPPGSVVFGEETASYMQYEQYRIVHSETIL